MFLEEVVDCICVLSSIHVYILSQNKIFAVTSSCHVLGNLQVVKSKMNAKGMLLRILSITLINHQPLHICQNQTIVKELLFGWVTNLLNCGKLAVREKERLCVKSKALFQSTWEDKGNKNKTSIRSWWSPEARGGGGTRITHPQVYMLLRPFEEHSCTGDVWAMEAGKMYMSLKKEWGKTSGF